MIIGIFDQNPRLNSIITENSDLITFHDYGNKETVLKNIEKLQKYNRPMINTEWMNRPWHSVVSEIIPLFYKYKVGCNLWGLVNGKTQTNLPWGHRPGDPEQKVWQHDLYHGDFNPYDANEITILAKLIADSKSAAYHKNHQHSN